VKAAARSANDVPGLTPTMELSYKRKSLFNACLHIQFNHMFSYCPFAGLINKVVFHFRDLLNTKYSNFRTRLKQQWQNRYGDGTKKIPRDLSAIIEEKHNVNLRNRQFTRQQIL